MHSSLATVDWLIIGAYLACTLVVGLWVHKRASSGAESYFLAGRGLSWPVAGISIAATTFAADTPLVVAGIVARDGLAGNWLWMSWILVHAGVVAYFARRWHALGVTTDAEFIALRYDGRSARVLRTLRAILYGVVFNAIVLGWVMRAMVTICRPIFDWRQWTPGVVEHLESIWPTDSPMSTAEDGMTVVALLLLVGAYSSAGGLRGVVWTDLLQFSMAMVGSIWLAVEVVDFLGGRARLVELVVQSTGGDSGIIDFVPHRDSAWMLRLELPLVAVGAYLLVQSFANLPADGGGYLVQRINATASPASARKASLLFLVLQYVVRPWPWFIVALAAVAVYPTDPGSASLLPETAQWVASNREAGYPALMVELMPPVGLGLLVASLLAAFMSTMDTHLNWGAAYVVHDGYRVLWPDGSVRHEMWVARGAVLGFVVLALVAGFHIDSIESAWRLVAILGASLGLPSLARWVWWRVNAPAELWSMALGMAVGVSCSLVGVKFELTLLMIFAGSSIGVALGIWLGRPVADAHIAEFVRVAQPMGVWPQAHGGHQGNSLREPLFDFVLLLIMFGASLAGGRDLLLHGLASPGVAWLALALICGVVSFSRMRAQ